LVRSSIRLSRGLDPENSVKNVNSSERSIRSWSSSESSVVNIAPVRTVSSGVGNSISRCINYISLVSNSGTGQSLRKHVDIDDFIDSLVVLCFKLARIISAAQSSEGLVVGQVGNKTTDLACSSSFGQNIVEDGGNLLSVVVPSEPSSVSGIQILNNVRKSSKLLNCIGDTSDVSSLSGLAFVNIKVGCQVRERIRLNESNNG